MEGKGDESQRLGGEPLVYITRDSWETVPWDLKGAET